LAQRRLRSLCFFGIMLFVKFPPWGAKNSELRFFLHVEKTNVMLGVVEKQLIERRDQHFIISF
jgi:hypothetical protein